MKVWPLTLVTGILVLGAPGIASAAAPECSAEPALYQLPAGLTWLNPRAPCTDADGDAITIEVTDPPDHGTLTPADPQLIDVERHYTANADAAGSRDSMKFVAVANGERSSEFQVDVWILPTHSAPECSDLSVAVRSGASVAIAPRCVDPDGDAFVLDARTLPKHGTYDPARRTYTAAPRFAGQDSMTFVVVDEWRLVSAVRQVAITVTAAPGVATNTADKTAPTLRLRVRPPLRARPALRRGLRLAATASEPGRVVIEALIDGRTARRLGIARRVGSLSRDIAAGRSTLRLRLYREVRGSLAGLDVLKLRLVARMVDGAGNLGTVRARVRLRTTAP